MPIGSFVKIGDSDWYKLRELYVKQDSQWRNVSSGYVKDQGQWKKFLGFLGEWFQGTAHPDPKVYSKAAPYGQSNIIITGGRNGLMRSAAPSSNCYRYDTFNNYWRNLPSMNVPRSEHACSALEDGTIVVAGGVTSNGDFATSVEYLEPGASGWVLGTDLSTVTDTTIDNEAGETPETAPFACDSVSHKNKFYLFTLGYNTGAWGFVYKYVKVFVYDKDSDTWTVGQAMPEMVYNDNEYLIFREIVSLNVIKRTTNSESNNIDVDVYLLATVVGGTNIIGDNSNVADVLVKKQYSANVNSGLSNENWDSIVVNGNINGLIFRHTSGMYIETESGGTIGSSSSYVHNSLLVSNDGVWLDATKGIHLSQAAVDSENVSKLLMPNAPMENTEDFFNLSWWISSADEEPAPTNPAIGLAHACPYGLRNFVICGGVDSNGNLSGTVYVYR